MRVDVLGEVLTTLELSSQVYFRAELSAPFAISVPSEPGVIRFHVTAQGPCRISVEGFDPVVVLRPGDLALVPHGTAHVLSDAAERSPIPLETMLEASGFDGSGPLRVEGNGPITVLVCGHFAFAPTVLHPIPASLPPIMLLRGDESTNFTWIEQLVRNLEGETRRRKIGYLEVVRRLSEIMLIEVLRAYADRGEITSLAAFADPQLGRALEAMHARPSEDWTLDEMARLAGLSRTIFSERFRERVGVSPMRYLTAWRMQKAHSLLSHAHCSVAEAARRAGYASESAFHRAFRDQFGVSPGSLRRAAAAP